MNDLAFRPAFEPAAAIRNGELAPTALVQAYLDRIDALNPSVNAFGAVRPEETLEEAAALQRQIDAGKRLGPLAGLPVGVQDLEDVAGLPTGVRIVGPRFRDDLVPRASYAYEQARPWNHRWPEIAT